MGWLLHWNAAKVLAFRRCEGNTKNDICWAKRAGDRFARSARPCRNEKSRATGAAFRDMQA
jgi:hypothetical protein